MLDTLVMIAAITVLNLAGLARYAIAAKFEKRAICWQPAAAGGGRA